MQIHSSEKIRKLKRLRKIGYSINELVKELSIPKTTVWHHVHNIKILPSYMAILKAKQGGSAKRKQKKLEEAEQEASKILRGPYKNHAITIAMLYWGEGSKKVCDFINSDGRMIKVYLILLNKIMSIQKKDIAPTLRIFEGMDKDECLSYWADILQLPKTKFIVRLNDGGRSSKTRYGMCRITIKKGSYALKVIRALIMQYSEEILRREVMSP